MTVKSTAGPPGVNAFCGPLIARLTASTPDRGATADVEPELGDEVPAWVGEPEEVGAVVVGAASTDGPVRLGEELVGPDVVDAAPPHPARRAVVAAARTLPRSTAVPRPLVT
jgi:hypothetical protein